MPALLYVLGSSLFLVAFAMQIYKPVVDLSNKTESLSHTWTFILLRVLKRGKNQAYGINVPCA